CWTTINLKTIHKPGWNPNDITLDEAEYLIDGRFCDGLKCNTAMGAHYTWDAAINGETSGGQVQGIAPEGWHIPSRAEWKGLNDWLKIDGNGGDGTNVPNKIRGEASPSGFDVLYAGNWGYGVFTGDLAAFWTSTEYLAEGEQTGEAYYRLVNQFPLMGEGHEIKEKGLSIRLVLDK
ncbi:MAG TPA: FISUMP domain-containing protein, partial [Prolixibacteraceae bacterium]|nr:FISUMP domain-containing protein [Prolixibacteraceae bacterium]